MRKQTLVSSLTTRFIFCIIGTREDANIHKVIECKYLSNNICTVVEEWTHGLLLPRIFLFLDTLRPRDIEGSEDVAAFGFWFLRTILALVRETASVSLRTLAFFFPHIPYPLSTPLNPLRFLTTAAVSIFPCLTSKFRNRSF